MPCVHTSTRPSQSQTSVCEWLSMATIRSRSRAAPRSASSAMRRAVPSRMILR